MHKIITWFGVLPGEVHFIITFTLFPFIAWGIVAVIIWLINTPQIWFARRTLKRQREENFRLKKALNRIYGSLE